MLSKMLVGAVLASLAFTPAIAQQPAPPDAAQTTPATLHKSGHWRASQIIGLEVYNDRNAKLGNVKELLLDHSGKATAAVISVGGFLGMGDRNVMVSMDKLRFSDEPRKPMADSATEGAKGTYGAGGAGDRSAEKAGDRSAETNAPLTRNDAARWFPDHVLFSGATKDTLKTMPEFKYD